MIVVPGEKLFEVMGDPLRVTVIATGLSAAARRAESRPDQHAAQPMQRTDTNNLQVLTQAAQPGLHGGHPVQHNHDGLTTPSVWCSAPSQAAAKVDALSSNGVGEIEIPPFLPQEEPGPASLGAPCKGTEGGRAPKSLRTFALQPLDPDLWARE